MAGVCEASGEGEGPRLADDEAEETRGRRRRNGDDPDQKDALYSELWHACAGSRVYVPKVEEKVYYFLQGHIEQGKIIVLIRVASCNRKISSWYFFAIIKAEGYRVAKNEYLKVEAYMKQDGKMEMPIYNLPPKILCKVVNVHLKAEPYTDEVFAQLTLIPMTKQEDLSSQDENFKSVPPGTNSRSFNKILTPSDTSTHGGFSVPKRPADECLPPLDMTQEPPVQELVAKDLHGIEWHFRHIYRGQPKRHLLTSGWSTFVSSKKLVAGDACIFLRGENGELRVGVRRATKLQSNVTASVISGHSMQHGILASACHAISTGSLFTVYYRPWTNPSEFLVPYDEYKESAKLDYSIGTRIKTRLDGEECLDKRLLGTIVGVEDFDRIRWPGSEWRCLEVQWDDAAPSELFHPERVSPWNIEPIEQTSKKHTSDLPRQKRSHEADSSLTKDAEHTAKKHSSSRVLQGQEGSRKGLQESYAPSCYQVFKTLTASQGVSDDDDAAASRKVSNNVYSSNSESQECHQQIGCSKIMIFGVNLVDSPPELPSPQAATSSGGPHSPRTVSPTSRSNVSESVMASEPSRKSAHGDLSKKQCLNCRLVSNRSCTKVLKYGTALGRSVDLTRFDGYDGLIHELDDMFDFKGSLIDKSNGWHVTYTDNEGDMMLLGDFPWHEFQSMVRKMFIYPKEELARMNRASPEPTISTI